ncbi:MAG: glycyl-radical enzyme activating protein [bacterium]
MSRTQTDSREATILEIQRMSTEDGPGIRTTVFFKGCSLQCSWCHNPESIARQPQLHWVGNRCIGCRTCLETCQHHVLTLTETGMVIDRTRCQACGDCAEACPSTALELMGKKWTLDDLVSEVIKDKAYFDRSGGGITISGGEPTLQSDFAAGFLRALKNRGIQTALDTCGLCSRKALESILPFTTMVLFDLKILDPVKHQKLTGSSNEKILSNLLFTADFIKSHVHPKTLWIRTPIIPGATDSEENIHAIGQYIAKNLSTLPDRWELCAFNNLCQDKYHRLDMLWAFAEAELMRQSDMEHLADIARKSGVNPDMVHWSGSTRLESEPVHNRPSLKAVNNCGIGS